LGTAQRGAHLLELVPHRPHRLPADPDREDRRRLAARADLLIALLIQHTALYIKRVIREIGGA
jgi:hypothetical protein